MNLYYFMCLEIEQDTYGESVGSGIGDDTGCCYADGNEGIGFGNGEGMGKGEPQGNRGCFDPLEAKVPPKDPEALSVYEAQQQ